MTINLAQIASLLRPGVNPYLTGNGGDSYVGQWKQIYGKEISSNMQSEVDVELTGTGLATRYEEGQSINYANYGERFKTTYTNKKVGIGVILTEEVLAFNLYKTMFPQQMMHIKRSLMQAKETFAMEVLNYANDGVGHQIGDGQALFSTTHPLDNGVAANTPTTVVDLSETALEDAITAIQQFHDPSGLFSGTKPKMLVIPPQLQWTAQRILKSDMRVGTADNDTNALRTMNAIPGGYMVNQYLTDPTGWYLLTDAPNGFKHYVAWGVKSSVQEDFDTSSIKVRASECYSFGVSNWRAVYGSM